jgi:hypothetical protein
VHFVYKGDTEQRLAGIAMTIEPDEIHITANLVPGAGVTVPPDYKGQPIKNISPNPITIFGTGERVVLQPGEEALFGRSENGNWSVTVRSPS